MSSQENNDHQADINAEEKLDSVLEDAEVKGNKIAQIGRELTEAGQAMADMANVTRKVVHIVKSPPNSELLIADWELTNYQANAVLYTAGQINVPEFDSTTDTAASTAYDAFSYKKMYTLVPRPEQSRLAFALEQFQQVSERAADAEKVMMMMKSLGLDKAPAGRKSALELFETAHAAYAGPVSENDPIVTSLIPMREAIRSAVDILLKKRPRQEKTRNEWAKIVSIGNQLKWDGLRSRIVNSWAAQWTTALKSYLSTAKEEEISRDEWRQRLVRSTLFLKGFLGGIDPSKLKP